jgi:hypothetical protein
MHNAPQIRSGIIGLTVSLIINALLAVMFLVFLGAAAGNSNQTGMLPVLLRTEVLILFSLYCIAIYFWYRGWPMLATCLPLATIPMLGGGLYVASWLITGHF